MADTSLHERTDLSHPRTGLYNGAETALSFGDSMRELQALIGNCGIFNLNWRAQFKAAGKDRVRWLHNMVTNSIRDLALNHGNYNFVLNAQGRILGDLYVYNRGEYLLLETDRNQIDPLSATIKKFIIMDKVDLGDAEEARTALGICGPQTSGILRACGVDVSGIAPLEARDVTLGDIPVLLLRGPEQKPDWYELWIDGNEQQKAWQRLTEAGAQPAGAEALELWRVLHGIPHYGQDIRDRDLPQETGQTQALHFSKGCYIGQEIVERIRSRGQVHRKFTGFELNAPLGPGKYDVNGRPCAEITTIARVPASGGEKLIALGYVRLAAVSTGTELELNGTKVRVVELPFDSKVN
jgi:folate-binding protein YgfZ